MQIPPSYFSWISAYPLKTSTTTVGKEQQQRSSNHSRFRAFISSSSSLLPHQAQEKMHQSPTFRESVLSFRGGSRCIIERAIELDYMNQIQNKQEDNIENNGNCYQFCTNGGTSQALLPHQAQEKMHQSPSFRNEVLSFKGQSNCLIERAIELDYITRLRNCMSKEN
mmetsp:Transcript_1069/g.1354  ORF Transcript_1069/g.1354 Transcript_1069/m.1354 type:complete len:167 (-) Transcript_1069:316-816(-)